MQTDATRTCELVVGLRDVTVLGVDERLRQPLEVWVDPQHPGSIALSRSQKVQVPLFDAVTSKWGMPPKCGRGRFHPLSRVIEICHSEQSPAAASMDWTTSPSTSRRMSPSLVSDLSRGPAVSRVESA